MPDQILPNSNPQQAPNNSDSIAYENSRAVKASQGVLFGVSGYNSGPAQFIQLHDATALPADAVAPQVLIAVAATSNFSIDFGVYGRAFGKGIFVCNSTTGPAKTIGAADCYISARFK